MHASGTVNRVFVFCVLAALLTTLSASQQKPPAPGKPTIAVLDFDAREGLSRGEAASLSDLFNSQLVETREFIVVDRNRIKSILQEQGFQQSEACSQVECIVEAGRILRVEKMFAGTIGKIGRIFTVSIQLIDIQTAQIQLNKTVQHSGEIEGLAQDVIPDIANEMAQELLGRKIDRVAVTQTGSSKWMWYVGAAVLVGGGAAAYLFLKQPESKTTPVDENLPGPPSLP